MCTTIEFVILLYYSYILFRLRTITMATNDVLQIHIPSGRWYNMRTFKVYSTPPKDDSVYAPIHVCGSCYTTHNKISSRKCKNVCTIKSQLPDYDKIGIYISRNNDQEIYISGEKYAYETMSSVINNYLIEMQVNNKLKKELLSMAYQLYHYELTIYTSKIPSDVLHLIMNYVYYN